MAALRRLSYAAFGAATSIAAPAGLLVLRRLSGMASSVADELVLNRVTYAYVLLASAVAFTLFGYIIGRQTDALRALATTDSLTGLLNRRAMEDQLRHEYERARRYLMPLSVLIIDVDGLKRINDIGGHAAGDAILHGTATAIQQTLRASDAGGRWGGDEFVIVAPHTSRESARLLARRVASQIAMRARTERLAATASIGVATLEPDAQGPAAARSLIEEADRSLYEAKQKGRGRLSAG